MLIVAHPACTHLCNSGVRWLSVPPPGKAEEQVQEELREGADLFSAFWNAPIDRVCVENPVRHRHAKALITNYEEPAQSVQPWQFGHGEVKRTCFWLRGLPKLEPTEIVTGREARVHRMPSSPNRCKERPRFFTGIASLRRWPRFWPLRRLSGRGWPAGYPDRLDFYTRLGVIVLGYKPDDLRGFQGATRAAGKYAGALDGLDGPQTRAAIHLMLVDLTPGKVPAVKSSPVTEEKPVAVTPPSLNAPWWQSKEVLGPAVGGGAATTLTALGSIPWQNLLLILAAFGLVSGFLYWRKRVDAKAVRQRTAEVEA